SRSAFCFESSLYSEPLAQKREAGGRHRNLCCTKELRRMLCGGRPGKPNARSTTFAKNQTRSPPGRPKNQTSGPPRGRRGTKRQVHRCTWAPGDRDRRTWLTTRPVGCGLEPVCRPSRSRESGEAVRGSGSRRPNPLGSTLAESFQTRPGGVPEGT